MSSPVLKIDQQTTNYQLFKTIIFIDYKLLLLLLDIVRFALIIMKYLTTSDEKEIVRLVDDIVHSAGEAGI